MQSSTKNNLLIAACYAGILALGMLVGPKLGGEKPKNSSDSGTFFYGSKGEKVNQVLEIIKENYVDPVKVDTLQNLAINQILSHLDPHSSYLPPLEAKNMSQDLEENYTGIGIEYLMLNDTMLVAAVHPGGPASKAGIKAGDKVLQINNNRIAGTGANARKIISLIKGRTNTTVKLLIKKPLTAQNDVIEIKRDRITTSSVDIAYLIAPSIGYIKISKFGARTVEDFQNSLSKLKNKGLTSLILDLRHNGGGYLNAATALADEFLPDKKLIVYTEGSHEPRTDYFATKDGEFERGKMVVLIDESSASASEIVAGALQDLDRAVIIGRRSFGKGLVQEQFNFGDGSALNLTIARYFTPLGRSIQRPYKVMSTEEYFQEPSKRRDLAEVDTPVKKDLKDSLYTKEKAYKTEGGHILYEKGGIKPDIYTPLDTIGLNDFYYSIKARGLLTEYFFKYTASAQKPASISDLQNFNISDDHYSKLVLLAQQKGVKAKGRNAARPAINKDFKAFLARFYFGDEAYYRVLNNADNTILRSLQELKQP